MRGLLAALVVAFIAWGFIVVAAHERLPVYERQGYTPCAMDGGI